MKKYVKMGLEWFHILLLLSIMAPAVYMTGLQRDIEQIYLIYAAGYLLVLPVIGLKKAVKVCRNLMQYLLVTVCILVVVKIGAQQLGESVMTEGARRVYTVCMMLGTFLIALESYLMRIYKSRRKAAKEKRDKRWEEIEFLLSKPRRKISALFMIIYIAAINYDCPQVCNLALYSTFLYLMLAIVYEYIDKTESYLRLNENTCRMRNVPNKRIYGIGKFFLVCYLSLIILAFIPALLTADRRAYRDCRTQTHMVESFPIIYDGPIMEEKELGGDEGNLPVSIKFLLYGFSGVGIVLLVVALIRWIWQELSNFSENVTEEEDIVESLELSDEEERIFRDKPAWRRKEEDKIRRLYRKYIRKHRKEEPAEYETPIEIETAAGVAETREGKSLHEQYEQVRYGAV